ncbi:MAG TPA: DNA-3-methyladenine glycosylase [Solirubrobacteraceae bacterium]|nr:DNA-3-methyladenine glycosylase [Solirubrobacteraceae bacterium]
MNAAFYARPVLEVAPGLIGCVLAHGGCSGVIVEAEAYHESEPAAHSYGGVRERNAKLFGPPGMAYLYRSYGIHACFNAVCEPEGVGAAVLIRALEPLEGLELMRARRGPVRDEDLCSGPGKLTQALGIDLILNGTSLLGDGAIRIDPPPAGRPAPTILTGTRIGITKAVELPWRFAAADSPYVSRPRLRVSPAAAR